MKKIIKLRKRKALLEIQKKFYWFPVVKKKYFGYSNNKKS